MVTFIDQKPGGHSYYTLQQEWNGNLGGLASQRPVVMMIIGHSVRRGKINGQPMEAENK